MDFGGVTGVYNTPMNTMGIGNPVPYGMGTCGSGDLFGTQPVNGKKKKLPKTTLSVKQPGYCTPLPLIVMVKNKGGK